MRSRNIKPGFFANGQLVKCDPLARILFAGLWCAADREGRLKDDAFDLKLKLLPGDNCDANLLLQQLHDQQLITRYEMDGNKYIQINEFSKHQKPHVKESNSKIPPLSNKRKHKKKSAPTQTGQAGENFPSSLIPDSLTLIPLSLPNGNSARAEKVTLETLSVDHNAKWLAEKRTQGRYLLHDEHFVLEQFKQYCRSKGKTYANYLDAYRNSFEWEKCQPRGLTGEKPTKADRARAAVMRAASAGGFAPEERPTGTPETSGEAVSGFPRDEDLREGAGVA